MEPSVATFNGGGEEVKHNLFIFFEKKKEEEKSIEAHGPHRFLSPATFMATARTFPNTVTQRHSDTLTHILSLIVFEPPSRYPI